MTTLYSWPYCIFSNSDTFKRRRKEPWLSSLLFSSLSFSRLLWVLPSHSLLDPFLDTSFTSLVPRVCLLQTSVLSHIMELPIQQYYLQTTSSYIQSPNTYMKKFLLDKWHKKLGNLTPFASIFPLVKVLRSLSPKDLSNPADQANQNTNRYSSLLILNSFNLLSWAMTRCGLQCLLLFKDKCYYMCIICRAWKYPSLFEFYMHLNALSWEF